MKPKKKRLPNNTAIGQLVASTSMKTYTKIQVYNIRVLYDSLTYRPLKKILTFNS